MSGLVRQAKDGVKSLLGVGARLFLAPIAPGLPALRGDEWAGCSLSFSQFGEDRFLDHILRAVKDPAAKVYVDVGAHHPVNYSNTLLLYKRGWHGVNIDASEEAIRLFRRHRPGDRNVFAAVSDEPREVVYHSYAAPATNQIGMPGEEPPPNVLGQKPIGSVPMMTRELGEILAENVAPGERIGFLNIDCEGQDLNLLKKMDWARWRPYAIAVESQSPETTQEMSDLLAAQGYTLAGKIGITLIFRQPEFP
jgi:FkbM family methyltransferase